MHIKMLNLRYILDENLFIYYCDLYYFIESFLVSPNEDGQVRIEILDRNLLMMMSDCEQ